MEQLLDRGFPPMAMKQYVVCKFVQANSVTEALKKAKIIPVHEVYLHGGWFEKNRNFEFFDPPEKTPGFSTPSQRISGGMT
jgi:hypothetical protein